jgi:hypothetical protein
MHLDFNRPSSTLMSPPPVDMINKPINPLVTNVTLVPEFRTVIETPLEMRLGLGIITMLGHDSKEP